jgi:hypothetical protein
MTTEDSPNHLCQPLFFVPKSWHRFFVDNSCFWTNLCQTCANPWHGFFVARMDSRAKPVPLPTIKILKTCANANPYIGVALGIGFENVSFLTRKNITPFSLIRRKMFGLISIDIIR